MHNKVSLPSGLNSEKAMYHEYMISRAFIPPWSLVMRDRKLSDQTLLVKAAGTLVSPSKRSYDLAAAKSRKLPTQQPVNSSIRMWLCQSDFPKVRVAPNQTMDVQGEKAIIHPPAPPFPTLLPPAGAFQPPLQYANSSAQSTLVTACCLYFSPSCV